MKNAYLVFILIVFSSDFLFSQLPPCDTADFNVIEGSSYLCQSDNITLSLQTSNCYTMLEFATEFSQFPGCMANVLNNPAWFTFVAQSELIDIAIRPFDCQALIFPNSRGMQAALYQSNDVDFSTSGFCAPVGLVPVVTQCGCTEDEIIWTAIELEVGSVYSLLIDGCIGDVCRVEVDIDGWVTPDSIGNLGTIQLGGSTSNVDTICLGAMGVELHTDLVHGATRYIWTLPNGAQEATLLPRLPISMDSIGEMTYSVLAANQNDTSDISGQISFYVDSLPDIEVYDTMCQGDIPIWNILNPTELEPGNYFFEVDRLNDIGCVQHVDLNLFVRPSGDSEVEYFKCLSDTLYIPELGFVTNMIDTMIYFANPLNEDCDTTKRIAVYNYFAEANIPSISEGKYRIEDDYLIICPEMLDLPAENILGDKKIKYHWENEKGKIVKEVEEGALCLDVIRLALSRKPVKVYNFVISFLDTNGLSVACEFNFPIEIDLREIISINPYPFYSSEPISQQKHIEEDKFDFEYVILNESNDLTIRPNPNDGRFEIIGIQPSCLVSVFNIGGQEQVIHLDRSENSISLSGNLSPGIYFIHCIEGESRYVKRFVVVE